MEKIVSPRAANSTVNAKEGSSSDSDPTTSDVGIRFSDAAVGELDSVMMSFDKLTFKRSNGDNIVVDTFTRDASCGRISKFNH